MRVSREKLQKLIKEEICLFLEDSGDTGDTGVDGDTGESDSGCLEGLSMIGEIVAGIAMSVTAAGTRNGRYLIGALWRLNSVFDENKGDFEKQGWYVARDAHLRNNRDQINDFKALVNWIKDNIMNRSLRNIANQACDPITDDKIQRVSEGIAWYYNYGGVESSQAHPSGSYEDTLASSGRESLRGANSVAMGIRAMLR